MHDLALKSLFGYFGPSDLELDLKNLISSKKLKFEIFLKNFDPSGFYSNLRFLPEITGNRFPAQTIPPLL